MITAIYMPNMGNDEIFEAGLPPSNVHFHGENCFIPNDPTQDSFASRLFRLFWLSEDWGDL